MSVYAQDLEVSPRPLRTIVSKARLAERIRECEQIIYMMSFLALDTILNRRLITVQILPLKILIKGITTLC